MAIKDRNKKWSSMSIIMVKKKKNKKNKKIILDMIAAAHKLGL